MAILRSSVLKAGLIRLIASMVPFPWIRRVMPKKFIVYGHLVSDQKHPVSAYYRYPTFPEFDRFIAQFRANGYTFVSLKEFLMESADKQILLTFDDGFKSIYDELHPHMQRHQLPYAIFILTDPLDDPNFYIKTVRADPSNAENKRAFLSEAEIIDLKKQGVHIGFHTRSHMKIEAELDRSSEMVKDQLTMPQRYDHLLSIPRCFAYPYLAPPNYTAFNAMMSPDFKYFFDTKGIFHPHQNHYFRICLDADRSLTQDKQIDVVIKRQFVSSFLSRIGKML